MLTLRLLILPIFAVAALVASCSGAAGRKAEVSHEATDSLQSLELPLPAIPEGMKKPEEISDYYVAHFWDAMDFADTVRSHSQDFIEQNFVNFISFFPFSSEEGIGRGVRNMLQAAEADTSAYELVARVADLYLYEPNSPYYSEDYYIAFLRHLAKSGVLKGEQSERIGWQLESALKNRPGSKAADFTFITPDGKRHSLGKWDPKAERILLMFYDPDCENCKATVERLTSDAALRRDIGEKRIAVLAIYSGSNLEQWKSAAGNAPADWTVGYDSGTIDDEDLYVFRAMPSLYLLDRDKRVIVKDASLDALLPALRQ